jgi:tRNA-dihydrouridine synthase A
MEITLNGGVKSLEEARALIEGGLDGVMIGRAAYQDPYMLAEADRLIFGEADAAPKSRHEILADLMPYIRRQREAGTPLHHITRHILGLFNGRPGARKWRRYLSENAYRADAGAEVVEQAAALVPDEADRAASA